MKSETRKLSIKLRTSRNTLNILNILKGNLNPSAAKLNLHNVYWFQQGNDPKHTTLSSGCCTTPRDNSKLPHVHRILIQLKICDHFANKNILINIILQKWQNIATSTIDIFRTPLASQPTYVQHKSNCWGNQQSSIIPFIVNAPLITF